MLVMSCVSEAHVVGASPQNGAELEGLPVLQSHLETCQTDLHGNQSCIYEHVLIMLVSLSAYMHLQAQPCSIGQSSR